MHKVNIPYIQPTHSSDIFVFAIEGCNGAGKTTLLNKYMKEHSDTECRLCVPYIYQTSKDIKHYMLFESSILCSALYYLAGAVEVYNRHNEDYPNVLFDRSLWSTFASAYAKDSSVIPILFNILQTIKEQVFLPNLIIVLDVSYETAKARCCKKKDGSEFDTDRFEIFSKKREFYDLLKAAGYPVIILDVNDKDAEEVYRDFLSIIIKETMARGVQ